MATDYRQGDYRVVAERLRPAAEQLVEVAEVERGDLVVDVAAGSGNVAWLCVERGASAVAVDRVHEQLLLGQREGSGISWVTGDAHALPLRDGVADVALSTFGLIYADRPEVAVDEIARVCRRGGTIGLTAWPSDGYQQAFTSLLQEFSDERPAHDHLAVWGTSKAVHRQLSRVADDIRITRGDLFARHASVEEWWRVRESTPPVAGARARLDDAGYAELGRRMRELGTRLSDSDGDGFVLRDSYLLAVARTRSHTT